jgi:hypothetical protein
MQIQRRTFLAMAAFCLSGIRAHAAEDIIGVWSSETANVQNNHLQLVFTPTEATFIVAQLLTARYEIDGNAINVTSIRQPGLPVPPPTRLAFSMAGAVLTLDQRPGPPVIMMRVDEFQPDMHPLIGSWTYQHPAGVAVVQRFSPGGFMQIAAIAGSDQGPYKVENGVLTMQLGNGPIAVRIKREGNVLIATGDNGRPDRFVKFE